MRLRATDTKNRRADVIPIRSDLAEEIQRRREKRGDADSEQVWPLPEKANGHGFKASDMIRRDLEAAGIVYKTEEGFADCHALRAFFVTELFAKGAPEHHVRKLARHRGLELTVNVYSKLKAEDLRDELDRLPPIPALSSDTVAAGEVA